MTELAEPRPGRVAQVSQTTDVEQLSSRLNQHLGAVQAAAEDNEFVDLAGAEALHEQLRCILVHHEDLDTEQRRVLADAINYFVRIDDDEDDLRSPIGFDDDAEVVEAALTRLRPASGGTGSGSATT